MEAKQDSQLKEKIYSHIRLAIFVQCLMMIVAVAVFLSKPDGYQMTLGRFGLGAFLVSIALGRTFVWRVKKYDQVHSLDRSEGGRELLKQQFFIFIPMYFLWSLVWVSFSRVT